MVQTLNIAQICPETHALGPGKRFVIWVQGCPFNCLECVAPDWIPIATKRATDVADLVAGITRIEGLEGLTISGGEPFLQAEGLAELICLVRKRRPGISTIAFSGFTFEQLQKKALSDPSIADLLSQLDVLIDGLYRADLNDNRGLRGSSNQRVHFLTPRYLELRDYFESRPREVELHFLSNELLMVGVPTTNSLETFHSLSRNLST